MNNRTTVSLEQLILRISQERGSFLSLSEEILLHDIQSDKKNNNTTFDGDIHNMRINESTEETRGQTDTDEKMFDNLRQQLFSHIELSQGESSLSQDFVSLLISGLKPTVGLSSMSPYLQANVPIGSLNADSTSLFMNHNDSFVSSGWKIESLNDAAITLRDAAKRLASEANKEVLYWKSVLSVSSKGEVLFKSRKGETKDLGVKYGFEDAGSHYHIKGTAILKRLHNGVISFQTDSSKKLKVIRVTIYHMVNGERIKTGVSSPFYEKESCILNCENIAREIQDARSLIFEEELFHEMLKEARDLASHRVQVIDHKIVVNLYDEILEVDFIDPTLSTDITPPIQSSTRSSLFCAVFRILLCNLHRRNLERRRQSPASLSTQERPKRHSIYILKPLLAHVLHEKILNRTRKALELLVQGSLSGESAIKPVTIEQESVESYGVSLPSEHSIPKSETVVLNNIIMNSSSYLGRLAVQPASKITINVPGRLVMIIVIGSPLQWYIPLYEAKAYKWSDSLQSEDPHSVLISSNKLHDLSDLEEWTKWILQENK